MNSDHVQRYHILDNGYDTPMPKGKWVRYEDIKHLIMEEQNYE